MSAIPLRDHIVPGLVRVETVDALLALGEPMVSDDRADPGPWEAVPYRCWIRLRSGSRAMGPRAGSVQSAADYLLAKVAP